MSAFFCVLYTSVCDKMQKLTCICQPYFLEIFQDPVDFKHCLQYFISSFTWLQKHVHLNFCILMRCGVPWKWSHSNLLDFTKNYLLFRWEWNYTKAPKKLKSNLNQWNARCWGFKKDKPSHTQSYHQSKTGEISARFTPKFPTLSSTVKLEPICAASIWPWCDLSVGCVKWDYVLVANTVHWDTKSKIWHGSKCFNKVKWKGKAKEH